MGGFSRRRHTFSAHCPGTVIAGCALLWATSSACADVYASSGADGVARYASQKLDSSYSLLYREEAPPGGTPGQLGPDARAVFPRHHQMEALVDGIARRHGVSKELIAAVLWVESRFNSAAVSPKGARGAMQLMPATARRYGLHRSEDLANPALNIDAGVRHLKDLTLKYQGSLPLALAAYNAGTGAVDRHGARIPPYPETMLYVAEVLSRARRNERLDP